MDQAMPTEWTKRGRHCHNRRIHATTIDGESIAVISDYLEIRKNRQDTTATIGEYSLEEQPSPELPEQLRAECMTSLVGVIDEFRVVVRGEDRMPTGLDPVNYGACAFSRTIAFVTVELLREGRVALEQTISLPPPALNVDLPLPPELVDMVPADLAPGHYDWQLRVTSAQGETMDLVLDYVIIQ